MKQSTKDELNGLRAEIDQLNITLNDVYTENINLSLAIFALEEQAEELQTKLQEQSIPVVTNVFTTAKKETVPFAVTVANTIDDAIYFIARKLKNY